MFHEEHLRKGSDSYHLNPSSELLPTSFYGSITAMNKLLLPLLFLLNLSSCAYVQTHENVQEFFMKREGDELTAPLRLGKVGSSWYLCTRSCAGGVAKRYPVVHDEIFLDGNNEPQLREGQGAVSKKVRAAWPISAGTATVLMREDGYATFETLADEMLRNRAGRLDLLPRTMQFYPVKAQIVGAEKPTYLLKDADAEPDLSLAQKALVQADRVLVDWPLSIAYNCAIPVMAPFVFFKQFLSED